MLGKIAEKINEINEISGLIYQIPWELIAKICRCLTPEETAIFGCVNKRIYAIADTDVIWEFHFEYHFSGDFLQLKLNAKVFPNNFQVPIHGWRKIFIKTYEAQYKTIESISIKKCFSRIRENKDFMDLIVPVNSSDPEGELYMKLPGILSEKDANEKTLIDWVREKNYSPNLERLYESLNKNEKAISTYSWTFLSVFSEEEKVSLASKLAVAIVFRLSDDCIKSLWRVDASKDVQKVFCVLAVDGNLSLFQFFIENGGENLITKYGILYLNGAVFGGHLDFIKYLLEKNVTPSEKTIEIAASQGHLHVIKFLKEKGIEVEDNSWRDSVYAAAENGYLGIIKYFFSSKKNSDLNFKKNFCRAMSLFIVAAESNRFDIIDYLLEVTKTLIPEERKSCLKETLYSAIWDLSSRDELFKLVQILVQYNKDNPYFEINQIISKEETALAAATRADSAKIIEYLIEEGAYPTKNLLLSALGFCNLNAADFFCKKYPKFLQEFNNEEKEKIMNTLINTDLVSVKNLFLFFDIYKYLLGGNESVLMIILEKFSEKRFKHFCETAISEKIYSENEFFSAIVAAEKTPSKVSKTFKCNKEYIYNNFCFFKDEKDNSSQPPETAEFQPTSVQLEPQ